jgi:hypothetical protein
LELIKNAQAEPALPDDPNGQEREGDQGNALQ